MTSDNETVAEIANKVRSGDYGCAKCGDLCDCPNADKIIASVADRTEAAHRREVDELRQCLKEAIEVACDGCHLAVWHNQKFVKCKKHSNWKCPFGTERWRKALEGANYEDK